MTHQGDTVRDLKIDGDRQVFLSADKDLATVDDLDNVKQSAVIHAGDELRPLVGEPITTSRISTAETALRRALQADPQLDNVRRVEINEVDKTDNTIRVSVFADVRHDFEIGEIL